jgi:excisionase family DNA binding protein
MTACGRAARVVSAVLMMLFAATCAAAEPPAPDEALDLEGAAALLRVPPEVLQALAEAKRLPARRVGEAWRFSRRALLDWLKGDQSDVLDLRAGAREQSAPPGAVGEPREAPTAAETALRDQRVLLRRGAASIDFGLAYARSEQTAFPIIRVEERAVSASGVLRYGLLDDLQATLRVPAIWRRTKTFTDATLSGTTSPRVTSHDHIGDASLSLLGVAWREAIWRPNVIWSLDAVLPTGPGDRGLGAGFVLSKSYDPAVVFAGISYLYGFSVEPADSQRSLTRHNIGASLGYTYALNDAVALNTLFVGTYRNTRSPDDVSIPPPRERYQLQLGMTWLLVPGTFLEPAVAMGLGTDSPNVTLSLNLSYSF